MKHLTDYENMIKKLREERGEVKELIPEQMYIKKDGTVYCFVGVLKKSEHKQLCFLFSESHDGRYYFIEWNDWGIYDSKPLNINIIDYVIDNKLIPQTIKSLKRISFSETPKSGTRKIAYTLRDKILNSGDIKMALEAEKFKL